MYKAPPAPSPLLANPGMKESSRSTYVVKLARDHLPLTRIILPTPSKSDVGFPSTRFNFNILKEGKHYYVRTYITKQYELHKLQDNWVLYVAQTSANFLLNYISCLCVVCSKTVRRHKYILLATCVGTQGD